MRNKAEPEIATQFRVTVPNLPGMLAKVTSLLLRNKINITGMMTESLGDVVHIRLLADRESGVTRVLENAGYPVLEVQVFKIDVPNKPGGLNRLAKALAEEDVNILCVYGTASVGARAKIVLAVDQQEKAAPIVAKWGTDGEALKTEKHRNERERAAIKA